MKNGIIFLIAFKVLLALYTILTMIVNFIKLIKCDFESPWKEEVLHLVGLIPIASWITAWL